ncbi:MAG: hypothetical protein KAR06_04880 [Deltaproteobacteria bacterium]|nr:hypothetical protein [Deltaproteobacteria bacterium]
MTDIEAEVLSLIRKGRENAIRSKVIADYVRIPERQVRLAIRELIKTYPIASTTEAPAGYFIAITQEEVKQYALSLKNRLIEDALRRRDFLRSAQTKVEPRQLELIGK